MESVAQGNDSNQDSRLSSTIENTILLPTIFQEKRIPKNPLRHEDIHLAG